MRPSQKLLLLDTGVKRHLCISKNPPIEHEDAWDRLIAASEQLIQNIEGDYELINTPISRLEYIGLGGLEEELCANEKEKFQNCFHAPHILQREIQQISNHDLWIEIFDREIRHTDANLKDFFFQALDYNYIIDSSVQFRKAHLCHKKASVIDVDLETWEKSLELGKGAYSFQELVRALAWNALFRHECFFTIENPEIAFEDICRLELNFLLRLIAYYLPQLTEEDNLPGTSLFVALSRIAKVKGLPKTKRQVDIQPKLFHTHREMHDIEITEFLCTGFHTGQKRRPVIAISFDQKKWEERIQQFVTIARYVNETLGENGRKIPFCPGTLLTFRQNSLDKGRKINVSDYL